ncbi:MAG TPA: PAS domain S-box protein [Armatimonadota bacterium]|nr:PAS domain S-box protein [Armatimonadota bacterium]HOS42267.1 PAS domain S-box protein [Armatimonadota bacterium]
MATPPDDAAALTSRLRACARQLTDIGVEVNPDVPADALVARLRDAVLTELTRCREQVTAARQAEDALRESEARYRALFTNMTEAFALGEAIFDATGRPVDFRFVEINEAFQRQTGLTRAIVGVPITEALPQVEPSWIERYGAVALTGEPVRFVDYNRDTARFYDVYCYRPEPGNFAILFRDVTRERRIAAELRESEARFRQLADAMPQLVWTAEPDGRVDYYNERRLEYAGITPTERDGYEWGPMLHPDDLQRTVEAWQHALSTGDIYQIEHRVRMADGRYRWHLSRGVPARDAGARIVKWYGTATDIEEVQTAREALRQLTETLEERIQERTAQLQAALARFEGLLESAPDGMVIVDASGVITLVNTQLERLTGYRREDILGQPIEVLIPERYRAVHVRHRAAYMAAPRTRPIDAGLELYLRCKDGRAVPVEISLSPITTPDGMLVMASIRDIAARKHAEGEITRLNAALQRNVEQLSAANAELEAFSYSVSHDLRAPLRGIDGFSRILLAEYGARLDETGQDYLRRVRAATQRMGRLIDDMLNLSRIGRREMQPGPVDLSALAAEVIAELRQAEPARAVTVTIAPHMMTTGDARLLRIVLENLLGNAWKFTGGRADARIEVGTLEQEGQTVYYIRDTGAGFDMTYADKLFTPFQRLHGEEEFPGTGIGLAIVRRIITRHGGRVWAEGVEGHGATFYFTVGEVEKEAA